MKKNLLLSFVVGSMLAGCGNWHRVDPIISVEDSKNNIFPDTDCDATKKWTNIFKPWKLFSRCTWGNAPLQINPYTYQGYYDKAIGKATLDEITHRATTPTEEERRSARNELQAAIMNVSDMVVSQHMADLKATEVDVNLLFGLATSGLTGGAAVAGATGAKVLSAAATGTNAARSLFNEQTYRNALVESLISLISAHRTELRSKVESKWQSSITEYPVERAIGDAIEYHEKGSFYEGLALVREATDKAAKDKTDSIEAKNASIESKIAKAVQHKTANEVIASAISNSQDLAKEKYNLESDEYKALKKNLQDKDGEYKIKADKYDQEYTTYLNDLIAKKADEDPSNILAVLTGIKAKIQTLEDEISTKIRKLPKKTS